MSQRRQYPFHLIEPKWQTAWDAAQSFRAWNPGEPLPAEHPFAQRHGLSGKTPTAVELPPKFYILDMFPYPSGAGLHVGHPEGYTATDILARYRRARGFNVLHPMGWDSFGLPAEQYAVKTGQHPRVTTEANITTFKRQIKSLGFSYDWTRELATTDPDYFRWTQWIFLQLYNSWFNPETNRAEPISTLKYPDVGQASRLSPTSAPNSKENEDRRDACPTDLDAARRAWRDQHRLAYVSEAPVNWCPELGTVLANEEVIDGKSEVGGFPVIRRPMRQWMLRITAYAEKLLADLDTIDWSDSLKEMQRNWIGRSEGAEVEFEIADLSGTDGKPVKIRVFTTRPDTLFGATYMVLAPEHKLVDQIVPEEWPKGTPYYWKGERAKDAPSLVIPGSGWNCAVLQAPAFESREELIARGRDAGIEVASLSPADVSQEALSLVKEGVGHVPDLIPFRVIDGSLLVALCNPAFLPRAEALSARLNMPVVVRLTSERDFLTVAEEFFPSRNYHSPKHNVAAYRAYSASKSDLERTELAKEKTGVFTGAYAINPVNGEKIPIWIADYVLASYGTGAIMAVPAHDQRDFEFAKKFELPIRGVVIPPDDWLLEAAKKANLGGRDKYTGEVTPLEKLSRIDPLWNYSVMMWEFQEPFTGDGRSMFKPFGEPSRFAVKTRQGEIDSEFPLTLEAKKKITAWLESKGLGKKTINYKLRDWLFSRQRYWGEPFPIVWKKDAAGNLYHEALPESALPLLPPALEDYKPTADGQPPLARAKDWLTLPDGSTRETNTMPQWAGSCWYYLRYLDARNGGTFVSKEAEGYWMSSRGRQSALTSQEKNAPTNVGGYEPQGVDLYVGGTEHAVLHLLYARFWHKVLFDLGHVSTPEPFFKLVNQGLILGEDGQKMSKSRGNVINPDDILVEYGADAFRLYEMFMGPLEMVKPWNTKGVEGVYRFLGRVWRLFVDEASETAFEQAETTAKEPRSEGLLDLIRLNAAIRETPATPAQLKTLHTCIKKVTEDLDGMRFNTAISGMMVFINDAMTWETKPAAVLRDFLVLLQPFAPHVAEELWAKIHSAFRAPHSALAYAPWPAFDPALLVEDTIEIPVQVNGKLRDVIRIAAAATNAEIEAAALKAEKAQSFLAGKTVKKIIVVPKKLVNIVAV